MPVWSCVVLKDCILCIALLRKEEARLSKTTGGIERIFHWIFYHYLFLYTFFFSVPAVVQPGRKRAKSV